MSTDWMSEDRADRAGQRILDGAEVEFAERGVAKTTMAAIARRAGCSRATVYAYFPNRHELRLAVVDRAAVRIADQVTIATAHLADPDQRLVEAVLEAVATVRATPSLAFWFTPAEVAHVHELADSSDVIDMIVSGFTDGLAGASGAAATVAGPSARSDGQALRARWILRVIVSLLTMPGRDDAEERALVERFVAPSLAAASA
jgi:AcrR family transcriptional regulator